MHYFIHRYLWNLWAVLVCLSDKRHQYCCGDRWTSGAVTVILTIVTCNIYALYWAYKQGEKIDIIKQKHGQPSSNSNILYLILCLLIPVVAWALMQNELNNFAN